MLDSIQSKTMRRESALFARVSSIASAAVLCASLGACSSNSSGTGGASAGADNEAGARNQAGTTNQAGATNQGGTSSLGGAGDQAGASSLGGSANQAGAAGQGGAGNQAGAAGQAGSGGTSSALAAGTIGQSAADYLVSHWPELDYTAADCTGPSNCFSLAYGTVPAGPSPKFWEYTYGVPLVGLYKLYELTGKKQYFDYVKKYVDRFVDADGNINYGRSWPLTMGVAPAPNDPTIQDTIQPSNLLFGLYEATKDARYLKAMANTRKVFLSIKTNSAGAFWHKPTYPNQQWLDAIYMSEPFLARYGAVYADKTMGDDSACLNTATTQIKLAATHTFDADKKLYRHAWNGAADGIWLGLDLPTHTPPLTGSVTSPVLWSRSLAWLIAGTVDVLEYLPKENADRAALVEVVTNVANGLEKYQDPATGLWYQAIDLMAGPLPANGGYPNETMRPAQPNWLETSASGIFAYSLAKAVRLGILPSKFLDVAKKGWAGVKTKIDITGDQIAIHGTVVGMSVGGTLNAYTAVDVRSDLTSGMPPAAASCPSKAMLPAGTSNPVDCKYSYVRDNVPQGFGAVLLAASEMEFGH